EAAGAGPAASEEEPGLDEWYEAPEPYKWDDSSASAYSCAPRAPEGPRPSSAARREPNAYSMRFNSGEQRSTTRPTSSFHYVPPTASTAPPEPPPVPPSASSAPQGAWRRTHTVPPSFDRGQTEGGRGPSREHRGSDPAGGSTGFWKEFWARQEAGAGARSSPGQCGGFAAGAPAYGRGAPSFSRRHFSTQDAWASWKPQPPPTPPTPPQRPPQRPASAAATRRAPPPADTSGMNEAAVLTTLEASLQRLRLSSVDEQKRATKELMARGSEGIQGGARRRPASSSGSRIGAKSCSASDRARAAAGHGPLGGNERSPPRRCPSGARSALRTCSSLFAPVRAARACTTPAAHLGHRFAHSAGPCRVIGGACLCAHVG
ncbi:unnamed protein product, partial [Prorocentrum cordatum]